MANMQRREVTIGYGRGSACIRIAFPGGFVDIETDHISPDGGKQILIGVTADQFPGETQHRISVTQEIQEPSSWRSGQYMCVGVEEVLTQTPETPAPKPVLVRYQYPRRVTPDNPTDDTQRHQHEYDRIANQMWREFEGGAYGPFDGEEIDAVGARFQEELDALEKGYTDKGYQFVDERPGARESFTYSTGR